MRKVFLFLSCIIICFLHTVCFASEVEKSTAYDNLQPLEIITVDIMNERLKEGNTDELLFIKINDNRVEVYKDITKDRSLRKQIIITMPNAEMLRCYTNNKAVYEQMSKMLLDYEESNINFNGYKVITDKDTPQKLENNNKIYRFWFMKIEREKTSRRSGLPINIGIGIGGHRHHHNGGPFIGIGI